MNSDEETALGAFEFEASQKLLSLTEFMEGPKDHRQNFLSSSLSILFSHQICISD